MLTPDSLVVRDGDLVTASLGEEIAMLNVDSGSYYVLDEIAGVIWESIQSATTPAKISAILQERYDVKPERCEAEVLNFLQNLHDKGLLRVVA